jgi:tight adherence protein B
MNQLSLAQRFRTALFGVALLSMGFATSAAAQDATPPDQPLPVESVDVSAYPTVKVVVKSPSTSSASVDEQSFVVTEAGERQTFRMVRLPTTELSVVLVIDTSKSMEGDALTAARNAAKTFVAELPAEVPVAVVGFGNVPTVASQFGVDRAKTDAALTALRARGNTTLYDAVIRAVALHAERAAAPDARKVIVLLTDGGDTRSKSSLGDASAALGNSGVTLTAIALATRETDQSALSSLASSATAGEVLSADDPGALESVFKGVADSVLNQFELTWTSSHHGAADIAIDLTIDQITYHSVEGVDCPAAVVVDAAVEPPVVVAPQPALIVLAPPDDRWLWMVGIGAGFGSLFFAWVALVWPRGAKRRLAGEYSASGAGTQAPARLAGFGPFGSSVLLAQLVRATDRFLRSRDTKSRVLGLLERAGMTMQPSELAVLAGLIGVVSAGFALALFGVMMSVLAALSSMFLLYLRIRLRADKRSSQFKDQFDSTLQIMSNSLKAGYGISQAIDTVSREAETPTRDEFRRVVRETQLGMDQVIALEACAKRVQSQDLVWVTDAIAINRNVGGNLTELFAAVAETIRARHRLSRQVTALSAEGKVSARILVAMPFLVMMWLSLSNRSYVRELFRGPGPMLLITALSCMTFGYFWLRRITRVEY